MDGEITGVTTGLRDLDNMLQAFKRVTWSY